MPAALKHFVKFIGKHLQWNLIFSKVAGIPITATLLKKCAIAGVHVHFKKFFITPFLQNTSKRVPLLRDPYLQNAKCFCKK